VQSPLLPNLDKEFIAKLLPQPGFEPGTPSFQASYQFDITPRHMVIFNKPSRHTAH